MTEVVRRHGKAGGTLLVAVAGPRGDAADRSSRERYTVVARARGEAAGTQREGGGGARLGPRDNWEALGSSVASGKGGGRASGGAGEREGFLIEQWPDEEVRIRLDRLAELALEGAEDEGWDLGDAEGGARVGTMGATPRGRAGGRQIKEDLVPMHLLPKVSVGLLMCYV